MPEDPRPRRMPGGALPPHLAPPRRPSSNGHVPDRALPLRRPGWEDLDAEDDIHLAAQRVPFRRMVDLDDSTRVRTSARPSLAVVVGVLVVVGLVTLAVVLYRMAPP